MPEEAGAALAAAQEAVLEAGREAEKCAGQGRAESLELASRAASAAPPEMLSAAAPPDASSGWSAAAAAQCALRFLTQADLKWACYLAVWGSNCEALSHMRRGARADPKVSSALRVNRQLHR